MQDSICFAAKLLENAERADKTVTPGNIAYFTGLHMRSGRRSYGCSTLDALRVGAQLNGRSTTTSLDEPTKSDEGQEFLVGDVLSLDEDNPAQKALRKVDSEFFLPV